MTSQTLDQSRDLSVNETCAVLGVTSPTIYKLLASGELDGYKVGRCRRVTAESLHRLRNSGTKAVA